MTAFPKYISASRIMNAGVTGISASNIIKVTIYNTGPTAEDSESITLSPTEARIFAESILTISSGD